MATVGSSTKSELEFWDLDFNLDDRREGQVSKEEWGSGIQQLGTADHYGVTDVEWDPSGRYLATSASAWRHTVRLKFCFLYPSLMCLAFQLENGYAIWDFRGQELQKYILDKFKQFLWRPRPRTLLTKEQQRLVKKNLREYSRAFDEEDAADVHKESAELIAQRKRLVDEWNAWRARCQVEVRDDKKSRGQKLNTEEKHVEEKEEIEVWIDEVIEQNEVIVD